MGDDPKVGELAEVLHQAAETHHVVFAIVDGVDDDWASWYADWLITLSRTPELLETKPVRSELVWKLVALDKEYVATGPSESWETYYARALLAAFAS